MPKKLLSLLAEEITEQGFGRYFQDAILPSGQRIGDVKSVDLSTGKPIDITISDTEALPNEVNDDEKYVGSNNEPLKDNDIVDISGQSTYRRKNERLNPRKYFMLHHTAGRGTAQGVISILNNRIPRLGVQWIIDRNGIVYRGLPDGSRGAHVSFQRKNMKHVNNSNTEGVEIIANDDSDVLDLQCKSALKLVKKLGYSLSDVYTHGQVSTNKEATEGQKCKAYFVKNWGTPFNMIDKNSEPSKVVGGNPKKELPDNDKNGDNNKIGPKLININKLNTNNYYSVTSKRGNTYGWRAAIPSLCSPVKPRYCDWHWHAGRDYPNNIGVPIAILKKGEVIERAGYCFKIKHYDNSITKYCHCDSVYFRKGDTVLPGDIIATVGNIGPSTGPHLHWEYFPPNQTCKTVTHASLKKGKVKSANACDVDPSGVENNYIVFVKNGKINDFKSDIKTIRGLG